MMYDLSAVERQHLAIKNSRPVGICIPKRCACGLPCSVKQLVQYGKCTACVQAAIVAAILPDDLKKLRHMLGAVPGEHAKRRWGWRNYYLAAAGQQQQAMRRLAAAGLVTEGRSQGTEIYFHATVTGCKAAGLDRSGINRATGD